MGSSDTQGSAGRAERRMATSQGSTPSYTLSEAEYEPNEQIDLPEFDPTGQTCPPGGKPRVTTTYWEDEGTLCFQVEAKSICVTRREDNDMINGTKLLNVAGMSRGKRDGILKGEKVRSVVKVGAMHLKGVWIPFERALEFANKEHITDLLYPLFVANIKTFLYHPANYVRTTAVMAAAQHFQMLHLSRNKSFARRLKERQTTPPHSAPILMNRRWSQEPTMSMNTPTTYINTSSVTQSLPVTPVTTPPGYFVHSAPQSSQEASQSYISSYSEPRNKIYHGKHFQRAYGAPVAWPLWGLFGERRASVSSLDQEELKQTCEDEYIKHRSLYQEMLSQQNRQPFHEVLVQKSYPLSPGIQEYMQKEGIHGNTGIPITMPGLVHQGSDDTSTINSQSSYSHQSVDDSYIYLSTIANAPHVLNDAELSGTTNMHFPFTTRVNQWGQQDELVPVQYSDNHGKGHSIFMRTWSPQTWKETSPCRGFYHQTVDTKWNNRVFRSNSMDQAYLSLNNTTGNSHQSNHGNIHLGIEKRAIEKNGVNEFNNEEYIKQGVTTSLEFNSALSNVSDMKSHMFSDMVKPPKRRKTIHGYIPTSIERSKVDMDSNQNFRNMEAHGCDFVLDI